MKNPFQKGLSFKTADDILDYLPEEERKLLEILRSLVLDCIPDALEKISYNVPFYSRRKRICFIWPASIPWGGVKDGVALGFTKGHLLGNPALLEKGSGRKYVYSP